MNLNATLRRGSGDRHRWLFWVLGAVLLLYLLFPFLTFLSRTGRVSLGDSLSSPAVQDAVRNSLLTAPVATLLATIFGVPLAYALARSSFRGQRLVDALVVLPLVLPPVVAGAMLLTGVGRFTAVGGFLAGLGVPLTDSLAGVVLAQTFVAAPFVVITARAGFAAVEPRLERASRSMGYGPLATFWHVSLPLARGTVLAGIVLTFARAIGEFGAVMMVAYNPRTMPTQIRWAYVARGIDAIVPIAIALLAVSLAVVLALQLLADSPVPID
jgi:molybdate/tungstate transport system permease protein